MHICIVLYNLPWTGGYNMLCRSGEGGVISLSLHSVRVAPSTRSISFAFEGLYNGATLVAKFRCYEMYIASRRQASLKVF
jgi:hypothetical protein